MFNNYQLFNVGIYLRLSQEDEKDGQSESIGNQRDFITRYVLEQNWNITDIYIDDGYSGLNFNRPDFKRMISDIEKNRINLVITKDMSRLGRDYIDTGHYLERYFPSKNIRYIAINDGIDTFSNSNNNDMSPFKAVINDMYAKDISKKVKTALYTKKMKGEFIGSVPPLGYQKDSHNKGKLIIEPVTSEIVKRIFSMFLSGGTKLGIANILSSEGIPTPSASKNLTATQKKHKGVWNDNIINRILTNPTYIGNLTQNRAKTINYKVGKKINLSEQDWIVIEDTHEPIISVEDFNTVQHIMKTKNYVKKDKKPHLLSGLVKCSDCGGGMTFVKESPTRTYMVCMTWRKHAKLGLCTAHTIREDYVLKYVTDTLKELASKHLNKGKILDNTKIDNPVPKYEKELQDLNNQLEQIKTYISSLYKDKVKGIITDTDFVELSNDFNNERTTIVKRISEIQAKISHNEQIENNSSFTENLLEKFLEFETIDRQTLVLLINKIEVFQDKKIKMHFNFHI